MWTVMGNYKCPDGDIQCERCGRCLQVCPTYRHHRIETFSPRGRLDLIRAVTSGELTPGRRYEEAMKSCLQCLACSDVCPKGVDVSGKILAAKSKIIDDSLDFMQIFERMILKVLASRRLFAMIIKVLAQMQRFFPVRRADTVRHLPMFLPKMIAGKQIPRFSRKSIHKTFPPVNDPPAGIPRAGRVVFFIGCFFGCVDTRPAMATVRVLCENGFQVLIPEDQACCGAPAHLGGYPDMARAAALKNLDVLQGDDPIVTICATCGNFLKNEYPLLFGNNPAARAKAAAVAERICDIHQFLADLPSFAPGRFPVYRRVTIHDPCHLNKGMHISGEIRRMLRSLPGIEIREMDNPDNCCGGGGLCALENHDLSGKLGKMKVDAILDSGADLTVTPCPGCLLQIRNHMTTNSGGIPSVHPIELAAETYGPLIRNQGAENKKHLFCRKTPP